MKTNISVNRYWHLAYIALLSLLVVGCGGESLYGDPGTVVDPTIPVASSLIISTDSTTVQSDGSDSATIKVLALDSSNGAVEGAVIEFVTTAGVTTASSAVTDANGEATIFFSAGSDPTVQTATITATSGTALPALIPVDIVGSTVTISAINTNLVIGGEDTATLTIKALDSGGVGVYNVSVSVTIDTTASTGSANLSALSGVTNTQGVWSVNLTGTSPGTVRVTATALNVTTSQDFNIDSVAGSLLITSPADGATVAINTPTTVTVSVPAGVTSVTAVSALGSWGGSGTNIRTWTGISGATTISDTLTSATVGTASIYVMDANNSSVSDNIKLVFVDKLVNSLSTVFLQASPTTIAPSTSSTSSSSVLEATVVNDAGNPIANARVTLSISNSTGSGEYVDPPVLYTDAYGKASSSLYAGTVSTDASGLQITASLDETLTGLPAKTDTATIIVNGTVGSISIGVSSKLSTAYNDTMYSRPVTVQVSDSGGGAVADVPVNISVWPVRYGLGFWACKPDPGLWRESEVANEDINKNFILDLGEDLSGDGKLTPPISDAGTVPFVVTTDQNGVATFNHNYLKDNAGFIEVILTATTLVQGTESIATKRFWLEALEGDVTACDLGPDSPFYNAWPILTVTADSYEVTPLGGTNVNVTLETTDDPPLPVDDGTIINAYILTEGTDDGTDAPHITGSAATLGGDATFSYVAGGQAGSDLIKITYVTGVTGVVLTRYLYITAL